MSDVTKMSLSQLRSKIKSLRGSLEGLGRDIAVVESRRETIDSELVDIWKDLNKLGIREYASLVKTIQDEKRYVKEALSGLQVELEKTKGVLSRITSGKVRA